MIHIFTSELTYRLDYSCRLLFETILGDEVALYTNKEVFQRNSGVKINYSTQEDVEGLPLKPHPLLFETDIKAQKIEVFEWDSLIAFFRVEDSFLPFDIFAASFYLVSRYEEYLSGKRDRHQRFLSRGSLANQHRFLEKPLVNCWALKMADVIEQNFEGYSFVRPSFSYLPTIDIDNAWAYKNKGFFRKLASSFKDLSRGKVKLLVLRLAVLSGLKRDPYDNYEFIQETLGRCQIRPVFFVLLNKNGRYDRSISHKNPNLRRLILSLSKWADVGIHPSYESNTKFRQLEKEVERLTLILESKVTLSRQHFLKISMPATYRRLIENGIEADYSMGFASRPGFRASICTPFYFFDLVENMPTSLKIVPFQVMDVTLRNYRGLSADEALRKIKTLMAETASVGGTFVSLWHNESLSDTGNWKGWRNVYTEMTQMAVELSK
ncbi:MAG TPA: polysaccharide deacetylase family protein [Prolixibacteraceae bacterium]|nr:polysaccharide deacetylase family protein [Prolixibacteraceae bacterium]